MTSEHDTSLYEGELSPEIVRNMLKWNERKPQRAVSATNYHEKEDDYSAGDFEQFSSQEELNTCIKTSPQYSQV